MFDGHKVLFENCWKMGQAIISSDSPEQMRFCCVRYKQMISEISDKGLYRLYEKFVLAKTLEKQRRA